MNLTTKNCVSACSGLSVSFICSILYLLIYNITQYCSRFQIIKNGTERKANMLMLGSTCLTYSLRLREVCFSCENVTPFCESCLRELVIYYLTSFSTLFFFSAHFFFSKKVKTNNKTFCNKF